MEQATFSEFVVKLWKNGVG